MNGSRMTAAAGLVLIIEDDQNLREGLQYNLQGEGYEVLALEKASDAEETLSANPAVSLIILDVMLPGEDGYSWCRRMRAAGLQTMVLMLTARTLEDDVIRGFEAGAQDYVTKPYRLRELLARVGALMRRSSPTQLTEFDDFIVDLGRRTLRRRDGSNVELTARSLICSPTFFGTETELSPVTKFSIRSGVTISWLTLARSIILSRV